MKTITLDKIKEVYSGRPGCACGCRGTYSDSDRSKKIILKKFREAKSIEWGSEFCFWTNETGTRTYAIHFKK